jgi:hypothetical protein
MLDADINQGYYSVRRHLLPITFSLSPRFLRVLPPLPYRSSDGVICCVVVSFTQVRAEMDLPCSYNSLGY